MSSLNNRNTYKNEGSEKADKKISKLESLKVFLQKKYISMALVTALMGTGVFAAYQTFKNKDQTKIEQEKDSKRYPFAKHHLAFRDDNTDFFTENLQTKKETLEPGITVVRDAGLTFYVVQPEDIKDIKNTTYTSKTTKVKQGKKIVTKKIQVPKTTITHAGDFEKIRNKLITIPQFSYLKETEYDRSNPNNKIKSFNIPKESVTSGMLIPIPLDYKVREIPSMDFVNYCYDALQEMKSDSAYAQDIASILSSVSEKELLTVMFSFARSETASEYTTFTSPIGDAELHRREPKFKSFSFTYFHILMEKNADNKTPGPGLKARLKLGLTEGQCYHPKNAAKLFLGYYIEKFKTLNSSRKNKKMPEYKRSDLFPITHENLKIVSQIYNGSSSYADKLGPNYEYAKFFGDKKELH